ncbi:ATPase domain-containing protein [Candidatus Laterigemmans baculatus]|uniref:ATPase domain-containing protein n=1 Tax=Candidatus Laterigemmans baculatus TaxID=2770505 RepID=UPI0013DD4874|nr:ATPase domain-containing protein [Candidatus Laterigemmans baculatus]
MSSLETDDPELAETGVAGLDDILRGGLVRNRLYLIGGDPGAGKTTIALQFLIQGARLGQRCLFVALSETEEELHATAASHGWSLEGIDILSISPTEANLTLDSRYTMYHPSEVELAETTKSVLAEAERIKPDRLVFDSLSELRLLAENPLRYRRQVLAMKQFFAHQQCTVLFITDRTGEKADLELQSIAHGVIAVERQSSDYGVMRRRLQIVKQRGRAFRGGYHDLTIHRGGVQVFPRLVAAEHRTAVPRDHVLSGLQSLDALLGGGISRGTSTLMLGAAGTGKSTLASQYAVAAAERGERSTLFLFDESLSTFFERSAALGLDVERYGDEGWIQFRQVDPAELTPGEFAHIVRLAVEKDDSRFIVIDSLNGYLNAMPQERFLTLHLHELLAYLGQKGVTTLMLMAQHGLFGATMKVPVDASYLADTVLLLRYFEALGEVRQAISVIKKRTGRHERTIRELRFGERLTIGEPLREFHGVLNGTPDFVGQLPRQEPGK